MDETRRASLLDNDAEAAATDIIGANSTVGADVTSSNIKINSQINVQGNNEDQEDAMWYHEMNLPSFILHSHSVLGLYFASKGEAPPVLLPCCCVDVGALRTHHRFVVFFYILIGCYMASIVAKSGSSFLSLLFAVLIVSPSACLLKFMLENYSDGFNKGMPPQMRRFIRAEGCFLIAWLGLAVYFSYSKLNSAREVGLGLKNFAFTWMTAAVGEVLTLVWKYFCCTTCCPCCLSKKYSARGMENTGTLATA